MGHLVSSSQLSLPHHSYPHVHVTWNVKAGHLALKASRVLRVAGTLLNGVQFPVVLEQQGVSISPGIILTDTLSTHWHTLVWRVTARVSFASALTPAGYVYMWELYKTCSQLTPSWYPGPFATWLCSFSKTWSLFPSPWAMAGAGTCFQPENVAAVTGTLWLTEQAQVHLLGDALLSPSPQATSADPQKQSCPADGSWHARSSRSPPPLPTVGVWTSGWFATKQRLTDTKGSVCSRCAGICQLCCLQTKNLITYYFKRMKYELENEKLFLWKLNVL